MKEYHKIETLFERDMEGSKKLIEGKFRNKTIEFLKDNEWDFTEKIDGTNIRVVWDGHNVSFWGRTDNAQIPNHLMDRLNVLFSTNEAEEMFEQKFGENFVMLFGEGYGVKIQKGGLYRNDVDFILFDVLVGDIYLERENVEDVAKAFGIDVVPIIFSGTLSKAVEYIKNNPDSTFGTAKMEGLVGRPKVEVFDRRGNRVIVKIKVCDFE
jgi:hypothetical protein